jgi:6-phosphogluconolactonase
MNYMSGIRIEVRETQEATCIAAAQVIAEALRSATAQYGDASLAVSGGKTPGQMVAALTSQLVPWSTLKVFQVDERCAPAGHADRNATTLTHALAKQGESLHLMEVPDDGIDGWAVVAEDGAAQYGRLLPARGIDVVHLGLGDDGHTASLVPGDAVLRVSERSVAMTGPYQGRHRMTLTTPTIEAARILVWLAVGASKGPMVRRLLDGDRSIPAGRFAAHSGVLCLDSAAAAAASVKV